MSADAQIQLKIIHIIEQFNSIYNKYVSLIRSKNSSAISIQFVINKMNHVVFGSVPS